MVQFSFYFRWWNVSFSRRNVLVFWLVFAYFLVSSASRASIEGYRFNAYFKEGARPIFEHFDKQKVGGIRYKIELDIKSKKEKKQQIKPYFVFLNTNVLKKESTTLPLERHTYESKSKPLLYLLAQDKNDHFSIYTYYRCTLVDGAAYKRTVFILYDAPHVEKVNDMTMSSQDPFLYKGVWHLGMSQDKLWLKISPDLEKGYSWIKDEDKVEVIRKERNRFLQKQTEHDLAIYGLLPDGKNTWNWIDGSFFNPFMNKRYIDINHHKLMGKLKSSNKQSFRLLPFAYIAFEKPIKQKVQQHKRYYLIYEKKGKIMLYSGTWIKMLDDVDEKQDKYNHKLFLGNSMKKHRKRKGFTLSSTFTPRYHQHHMYVYLCHKDRKQEGWYMLVGRGKPTLKQVDDQTLIDRLNRNDVDSPSNIPSLSDLSQLDMDFFLSTSSSKLFSDEEDMEEFFDWLRNHSSDDDDMEYTEEESDENNQAGLG